MPLPAKDTEFTPAFRQLLQAAKVRIEHLQPRQTASIATTITADTSDALKGLAKCYSVMPRDIIRACIVIGLEELIGCAEELGHAAQATPD